MADHHDHLDSALNLLRSRQWAGPATNPVLEKQFMHPNEVSRGLNLRLVLSIAGALIGCGAVAAASRPAWRATIFGPAPQAPKAVASASPAPVVATPTPSPRKIVHRTPAPGSPVAAQPGEPVEPALVAGAPSFQVAEMTSAVEAPVMNEPDESELLRAADPACYFEQALAMYLDRYMAGDLEGCEAVVRAVDGGPTRTRWFASAEQEVVLGGARLLRVDGMQIAFSPVVRAGVLDMAVSLEGVRTDGEDIFEVRLGVEGQDLFQTIDFQPAEGEESSLILWSGSAQTPVEGKVVIRRVVPPAPQPQRP